MALEQRAYGVLVVSCAEKFNETVSKLLPEAKYPTVTFVGSINAAKRKLLERSYDFIFVNAPLPDDFGTRFAIDTTSGSQVVLLFVKTDQYDDVYPRTVNHGVFTIRKPTSAPMVTQSLDFMCATRERLRRLEKKATTVEEKMEEIRLINRAKWLLIDNLKMTEPDAHRYIEKQAMDRCITRREAAENVIRTYAH